MGSCWGRGTEHELVNKTWAHKKNFSYKFIQLFIKKCLSQICISLCPIAPPWGAKQNTIRVIRGANAKLPHHKVLC
jgi:hypothetical protein